MSDPVNSATTVTQGGQPIARPPSAGPLPSHIGRYRVERLLGEGGFARVYLAYDEELRRAVAVKAPLPERVRLPGYAETYLAEGRTLAGLDHPNIVPVHDLGRMDDGLPFIVSKYVEGTNLAVRMRQGRPSAAAAAALTATVAEALHYAHLQGLVHRDVKPANILLDADGKPYVADFGLALREEDFETESGYAGTPGYMSPEQARGEGHRIDGRSDVFSLGVVFYELLTARRPFHAPPRDAVPGRPAGAEARPPRQWDDAIPKELERICLKALSIRASDRYTTAKDMADDLRHFLTGQAGDPQAESSVRIGPAATTASGLPAPYPPGESAPAASPASHSRPLLIVPKGLRSFDAHDADFFLELLPGPRDRDGLPDNLRFWKTRLEETEAEKTFAVGLMCGPSGCGKSSLVKAGLLPRLSDAAAAVYLEATGGETEARLLGALRKRWPALPADLGLKETLATLRRGEGVPDGKKLVIILDQFEQWLHAKGEERDAELVQALRQCDGGRVQCVVMVRDDFWMAVIRFMRDLEIRLHEGENSSAVDLFDPDHARKVLAAFGRAFGRLPESAAQTTKEQKDFLAQAAAGLTQGGKVVCVRLALFAEMMKGKPWTPASLRAVGGAQGVGVTFLEETFSAAAAPPEHRYHQKAARAVLKALLPEAGADIKGHMRRRGELLEASGYANNPADFDDLIRILDGELRLLTPTDPEGGDGADGPRGERESGQKYYQLTHDYLVHSLRDWLARKQKETRRGRAELRLAEWAASWNSRPENTRLPGWWEWAVMRLLTRARDWTPPQRRMMARAGRRHALQAAVAALLLAAAACGGWWAWGAVEARAKVDALLTANTAEAPQVVRDMAPYRRWAGPLLREAAARGGLDEGKRLHVAMALLPVDPAQADYLGDRLLAAKGPDEVKAVCAVLREYAPTTAARFWPVLQDAGETKARRLRAACALALCGGDDPRWDAAGDDVVRCLAAEKLFLLPEWAELLEPVRRRLVSHQVRRLMEADASGFAVYLTMLRAHPDEACAALQEQLERAAPPAAAQADRRVLAERQAQAGAAVLLLGRTGQGWPLFHQGEDPTRRTYLIHRCAVLGVEPMPLAEHVLSGDEQDPSVRQGLLLALGQYGAEQRDELVRGPLVDRMLGVYRDDPDPGVHSAAEWLLFRWGMAQRAAQSDAEVPPGMADAPANVAEPRWEINGQGQTFALIPAPGPFEIGSPPEEAGRSPDEARRPVSIDYSFAVGLKLVTVAEFKRFKSGPGEGVPFGPDDDSPVSGVTWYEAAQYCNWLSEQEHIPKDQWCYEPNARGKFAEGMKVKATCRSLAGYRLPREEEWEYACRAGTTTAWSFGSDETLLDSYAWSRSNAQRSSHSAATKMPNGLGLFDVHGNVWEWCEETTTGPDADEAVEVRDGSSRVMRGGSHADPAQRLRSANRPRQPAATYNTYYGFRVVRTCR